MNKEFISNCLEETQNFAEEFAKNLRPGSVLALYGELGAGKTAFIQGLAAGLGYRGRVFSPTFIFVRPYKLNSKINSQKSKIKMLYHIDLYRVEKSTDLKTIGIDEFLNEEGAASAIEWPEKIEKQLPPKTVKIKIEVVDEHTRRIRWT
ncbi:MAG TPA: tRNA (adenosine(37)-N6)-threonylcarbamoyltransferase complex ATPase subunit type 1 TsaE [Candidatus Nanoarchaeia archaeon]